MVFRPTPRSSSDDTSIDPSTTSVGSSSARSSRVPGTGTTSPSGSVPVTLTLDPATLVGFDEEVPPRFDSTIEPGAGSAMFQVRVPVNTDPDQPYPYNPQAVSEGDYLVSSTISWAMEVAAGDAAAGYLGVALTCTSEFDRTDPENWTFLGWTPSVSVEARSEAAPLVWGTEWTGTCDEPVTLTADDGTAVTVQGTCDGTQLTLG